MLSTEAEKIITYMKEGWKHRPKEDPTKNPKLAAIEAVYAERAMVENPKLERKVPDRIAVIPDMADGVYGEWLRYLPEDTEKVTQQVILFLHGGGFQTGSCLSRRTMAAKISALAKVDTFIINYRLAPEYPFPAGLNDCVTAYLWLLKKGYQPEHITIAGESAGGNLTLAVCHYLRDHYFPLPGSAVVFSPAVNLEDVYESRITKLPTDAMLGREVTQEEMDRMLEQLHQGTLPSGHELYATEEEKKSPYVSPIKGDFTGFPRLLIEVGGDELLYDDACELYKKTKDQGVDVKLHVWEGLFHVFALFDMPETESVLKEIADFIVNK